MNLTINMSVSIRKPAGILRETEHNTYITLGSTVNLIQPLAIYLGPNIFSMIFCSFQGTKAYNFLVNLLLDILFFLMLM